MIFPSVPAHALAASSSLIPVQRAASASVSTSRWLPLGVILERAETDLASTSVMPFVGIENVAERNLKGGSDFFVPNTQASGFQATRAWGPGMASFGAEQLSYDLQDAQFPASIHRRAELAAQLAFDWTFALRPDLSAAYGVGYALRSVAVQNAGAAPQPSFIFSTHQLYQGPALRAGLAWRGWRFLSVGIDTVLQPYILPSLDAGVPALSTMSGRSMSAWVQSDAWNHGALRLSYRHEILDASGLELSRDFDGPMLGLMLAF